MPENNIRFTQQSHWPDHHNIVPLVQFADQYGRLQQDGQYVPQAVIDRLAAYEDSGWLPENVQKLVSAIKDSEKALERAKELLEAEENGTLIEIPFKVGEKAYLYNATKETRCEAVTVEQISVHIGPVERNIYFDALNEAGEGSGFFVEAVGKTVFRTEEEARAAAQGKEAPTNGEPD